jgi:uncharacterized protein YecE (DUF72 family)
MDRIRIGISGWRYAGWRGAFYPPDLPHRRELEYASRAFDTIELNGSFYSLQRPASYEAWYRETPDGFVFAVKGSRYITHFLKLREIERPLANFFASGLLALREKLGPLLWQLPPQLAYDAERLERFLSLLPRDTTAALALAQRHDARMTGRAHLPIDRKRRLRHAVEIRHESFCDPSFVRLLRRHRVALVVSESAGHWPLCEDVTADFVYLRLHGDRELYASGYSERALDRWAERIRAWAASSEPADAARIDARPPLRRRSRDVYCYFDNDAKVRAPFDAQRLACKLGLRASVQRPYRALPRALGRAGAATRRSEAARALDRLRHRSERPPTPLKGRTRCLPSSPTRPRTCPASRPTSTTRTWPARSRSSTAPSA